MSGTKLIGIISTILLFMPLVFAAEGLVFSTDRTEYYFPLNQQASILLNISNSYQTALHGTMSYTLSQKVQTGNSVIQSSNSQAQTLSIAGDQNSLSIGLGTSNSPAELDISMQYTYSDPQGKQMQTTLSGVKVYFVQDNSQQNSSSQGKESTSKSQEELQKEQEKQQKAAQEEQQRQQEAAQKAQQEAQKFQNRLQNNQQYQDSNQLKQQMQKQAQEEQAAQEALKKAIEQNQEFQEAAQKLSEQGFNQTEASIDAINSTDGSFKVDFQGSDGKTASIEGKVEKGNVTSLNKTYGLSEDYLRKLIEGNETYQKYDSHLKALSFNQSEWQVDKKDNSTEVDVNIPYEKQESSGLASITARVVDGKVLAINMKKNSKYFSWTIFLWILVIGVLGVLVYRRFGGKNKTMLIKEPVKIEEPYDGLKEARRLLNEAKDIFDIKDGEKAKIAHMKLSQALRIYHITKLGMRKDVTTSEIVRLLKGDEKKEVGEILNHCLLIEFAKIPASEEEFEKHWDYADGMIR